MNLFKRFLKEESGQSMIEYAVMAFFLIVIVIGAIRLLGGTVKGTFEEIEGELKKK